MAYTSKMRREDKARSGITLGGIGTGGIELRKDGIFRNWHIFNNEPLGTGERHSFSEDSMLFFIVRYQEEGSNPKMKLLQIEEGYEVAAVVSQPHYYIFPWLSGIEEIDYTTSFPFAHLKFSDEEMPFDIEMQAFSPFIPHDVKNSSLPGIVFQFEVKPKTEKRVEVMIMASLRNAVGYDWEDKAHVCHISEGNGYKLFEMTCSGMDTSASTYGSLGMASLSEDSTYYTGWEHLHPYYEIVLRNSKLPNINDTDGRNSIDQETGNLKAMYGMFSSIAVSKTLVERKGFKHTFIMGWNFPNLYAQENLNIKSGTTPRLEGHYYSNYFKTASDVIQYLIENLDELEGQSRLFHKNFFDSSLEETILDQINSHLNTFVTSSWLTKKLDFGIQEGITPKRSWGPLATMDVGMYGNVMVGALFPELEKNTMRAHRRLQAGNGEVAHGISRNFSATDTQEESVHSRLDLPAQYVIQSLKGYFWTNDRCYLEEMWPSIIKALEYVLCHRDQNQDSLPDMEGKMCSYDNFPMYGVASYVASQWLSALCYATRAAEVLGDTLSYNRYHELYLKGRQIFEQKLWNGEYYRLYNDEDGPKGDKDEGCLTDQLLGQWANHLIGAGELFDTRRTKKALGNIIKKSYTPTYGLSNCRWPQDEFLHEVDPDCWNDQANTCWTGVELAFASLLIYEGMVHEGFQVIKNVDRRYRSNGMYFDHMEFGGHYFRGMSVWAIINAVLGLTICGAKYGFAPKITGEQLKLFFTFGSGTAHYIQDKKAGSLSILIQSGEFTCSELNFSIDGVVCKDIFISIKGKEISKGQYHFSIENNTINIVFYELCEIDKGDAISIKMI